jgi:hypothetical protein
LMPMMGGGAEPSLASPYLSDTFLVDRPWNPPQNGAAWRTPAMDEAVQTGLPPGHDPFWPGGHASALTNPHRGEAQDGAGSPEAPSAPMPMAHGAAESAGDPAMEPETPREEGEVTPENGEAQTGFKLYPDPAVPVVRTEPLTVPLASRHPLAPRASGTATVRTREGILSVSVRGLPTPAALGRDGLTGRPLNSYRVWLLNQRTGQRLPLGFCTRVWGENFRFQTDEVLPLTRFDAILITAEDRTLPSPNPNAPQVLIGHYSG